MPQGSAEPKAKGIHWDTAGSPEHSRLQLKMSSRGKIINHVGEMTAMRIHDGQKSHFGKYGKIKNPKE